MLKLIM